MPRRDQVPADYSIPKTSRLRRRLLWQLRRMRDAIDVETLEVFEHELSAFERAGVAELDRQRTRNVSLCAETLAAAQKREELIRSAIIRTEEQIRKADAAAERLDAKLLRRDPDLHTFA